MDTKLKSHMQKVEEELLFEELKILREIAMDCLETEQKFVEVSGDFLPKPAGVVLSMYIQAGKRESSIGS